ncbi:amino acid adenylation domain-containing protein [Streptomyces sp. LBUM 1476]|nr:amino acid adenylation domain-containing protein [Streptomyces sp. LBUM 1476]
MSGVTVTNGYGPTETTTFATNRPCSHGSSVPDSLPIGRPLDGMRAYVLDPALRPVPRGIVGELYLSGNGVARGYLGRPGATAERFVADPHGPVGARMYRTGDRVRVTDADELEFHGRTDSQLKLRGFRIEPAEIEAALAGHPGVTQAVVTVRGERLIGYAVSKAAPEELRAHLAARLPEYAVPGAVVPLDHLPLTPTASSTSAPSPRRRPPPTRAACPARPWRKPSAASSRTSSTSRRRAPTPTSSPSAAIPSSRCAWWDGCGAPWESPWPCATYSPPPLRRGSPNG